MNPKTRQGPATVEAIILAGGLGKRLRAAVKKSPKPMALVNEQPFLSYVLNFLLRNNIPKVILAIGYMHEKIEAFYGSSYKELQIEYSVEEKPLGTGGALKQAFSKISSQEILIMNGDTFFDVNIEAMFETHKKTEADLTIALKPMHYISRYGIVNIEGTQIKRFEEKKKVDFGYINAGVYISRNTLFDAFDLPETFSFEEDFLKKYTSELNMHAHISDTYFIDIGVPEDYRRAQTEMKSYE